MTKTLKMPRFRNQSDEADWWASRAGRDCVERKSGEARVAGVKTKGSSLVARLNKKGPVTQLGWPRPS